MDRKDLKPTILNGDKDHLAPGSVSPVVLYGGGGCRCRRDRGFRTGRKDRRRRNLRRGYSRATTTM